MTDGPSRSQRAGLISASQLSRGSCFLSYPSCLLFASAPVLHSQGPQHSKRIQRTVQSTPMTSTISFIANPPPFGKPRLRKPPAVRPRPRLLASGASKTAIKRPDAGLITKPGITGTVCANLWPIPVFGSYSWFLNVYDREVAAAVGPFVITSRDGALRLEFRVDQTPHSNDRSESHRAYPGVATGNINVRQAVESMNGSDYELLLFERGGSENFLRRRNEVHVLPEESEESVAEAGLDFWNDPAPTYRTISRTSSYELREVYAGGGASPRATTSLQYFAMNLFPIFPFTKYSCFVCVWKQREALSPLAIDKLAKGIKLSFFDPLEIGQSDDTPPPIAQFAAKVFFGAVTDEIAATQHKMLLDSIASSPSTRALSENDFRLVIDNTPGTISPNRRNEIWVQVE